MSPCPACGRSSWCSRADDLGLVACRRAASERERLDRNGDRYWLHPLPGCAPSRAVSPEPPSASATLAPIEVRDRVYRCLLGMLRLSSAHSANLQRRGLSADQIDQRGYRSLPPRGRAALARSLVERFGAATCSAIPGLYQKQDLDAGRWWWSLAGSSGLLIPCRDRLGRVIALRIRGDDDPDRRYSWLSSTRYNGPGPGACVHVPLHDAGAIETVRLTEGELKSDIATYLSGVLTVSVPGVGTWRLALPIIQELGAERVLLAFDQDARSNSRVARSLRSALEVLEAT